MENKFEKKIEFIEKLSGHKLYSFQKRAAINLFETENNTEYHKLHKKLGKCIGYIEDDCINCGRHRVELWEDGSKICEKCCYNQESKEYESNYYRYM